MQCHRVANGHLKCDAMDNKTITKLAEALLPDFLGLYRVSQLREKIVPKKRSGFLFIWFGGRQKLGKVYYFTLCMLEYRTLHAPSPLLGHLVLLHIKPEGEITLFDPLGSRLNRAKGVAGIWTYIRKRLRPDRLIITKTKVQSDNSCLCGVIVLFVAFRLSEGLSITRVLRSLSKKSLSSRRKVILEWFETKLKSANLSSSVSAKSLTQCQNGV